MLSMPPAQGLCTCCTVCLEVAPPDVCMVHSLTSFRCQFNGPLIRDAFLGPPPPTRKAPYSWRGLELLPNATWHLPGRQAAT